MHYFCRCTDAFLGGHLNFGVSLSVNAVYHGVKLKLLLPNTHGENSKYISWNRYRTLSTIRNELPPLDSTEKREMMDQIECRTNLLVFGFPENTSYRNRASWSKRFLFLRNHSFVLLTKWISIPDYLIILANEYDYEQGEMFNSVDDVVRHSMWCSQMRCP